MRKWIRSLALGGYGILRCRLGRDEGNAMVEFVFLGIILLIPLVYLVLAVSYVQRNVYGVTQAAREVGRTYATSGDPAAARYAARLALQDQGGTPGEDDLRITWAGPGQGCDEAADGLPPLSAGQVFTVCVRERISIPGVPHFVGARHNSVTGKFVVHVDDYADVPGSEGAGS